MPRPILHRRLFFGFIFLALAGHATTLIAQPVLQHFDSIEWMTAESDLILHGKILSINNEKDPLYGEWQLIEFRTLETLKGDKQKTIQFFLEAGSSEQLLNQWQTDGTRLIVFLTNSRKVAAAHEGHSGLAGRRYVRYSHAPRTGYVKGSFLELTPKPTPAYSMTMKLLDEPDDLKQTTKTAIAHAGDSAKLFSCGLRIPAHGNLGIVTVPIDSRLEAAARAWVRSDDIRYRVEGAKALLYFRSDENVETLKDLLEDQGSVLHLHMSRKTKETVRVYEVREAAFQVLGAWGVSAPMPVVKEVIAEQADE